LSKRMNWNRARKLARDETTILQRRLEAKADHMILKGDHKRIEGLRQTQTDGKLYYRAVGSVQQRDGRWYAMNGVDEVVGEYDSRWMAWEHADQFGMKVAGSLA